jgi:hypothetical protein
MFSTFNPAQSAFILVWLSTSFFTQYQLSSSEQQIQDNGFMKFHLPTLCSIYRPRRSLGWGTESTLLDNGTHSRKIPPGASMWLLDRNSEPSKLEIKLAGEDGAFTSWQLHMGPVEPIQAVYDKNIFTMKWIVVPGRLNNLLGHLHPKQEEITMICTKEAITLKTVGSSNYSESQQVPILETTLKIDPEEFEEYDVTKDIELVFSLKELKVGMKTHLFN